MLTKKEYQIIALLKEGKLNKEIADTLTISLHTVKNHLKNIYRKLEVRNRAEAIVKVHHTQNFFTGVEILPKTNSRQQNA